MFSFIKSIMAPTDSDGTLSLTSPKMPNEITDSHQLYCSYISYKKC